MRGFRRKILAVDDAPTNLRLLGRALGAEHDVLAAPDGLTALDLARSERPDLILLDIMMPGLDGLEVCRRLKADPATADIPVIFITAMSGEEDEARGFSAGAVDYITKPLSLPVVRARVALHLELARARAEAEAAYSKLAAEIDMLADLQERLLPRRTPNLPGLSIRSLYRPSGKASGDYFDYFRTGAGTIRLIVADVSGHGARAAFVMAIVRSLFRLSGLEGRPLGDSLRMINEHLLDIIGDEPDFVTVFAADFDPAGERLAYLSAGHCPALLKTGDGRIEELGATCPLLGFFTDPCRERSLSVAGGFELLVFTDGCYEWRVAEGEIFSLDRFLPRARAFLRHQAGAPSDLGRALMGAPPGGARFDDDLTALWLSYAGPEGEGGASAFTAGSSRRDPSAV